MDQLKAGNILGSSLRLCLAVVVASSAFFLAATGNGWGETPKVDLLSQANDLFKAGAFIEAEGLFSEVLRREPENYQACLALGKINLYQNRYAEAEALLKKAAGLKPEEVGPQTLLGELYCRQDRFQEAEPLFRRAGRTPIADRLRAFKDVVPYDISGAGDSVVIPFIQTDPLPVVGLRLNDQDGFFLIDTGGPELVLDPDFGTKAGAKKIAEFRGGVMAGGKPAPPSILGSVDLVQMGDFAVRNVPVIIMDTTAKLRGFSRPLAGVLGTILLSRFIFTLDYPGGRLVLRRKTEDNKLRMKELAGTPGVIAMPFWMAGDHFMLAEGSVNGTGTHLFLLDTGLMGGGLVLTETTVKEAGISLPAETQTGIGGGGEVNFKRITAKEVTLGPAKEVNVAGVYGAFPPSMEFGFGFRLAGIISHTFFRSYQVTFDFSRMQVLLQKTSKTK